MMLKKHKKNGTKISEENWRSLQREIINTEEKLKNLKSEASNWTKAGQKIDEYGQKIKDVGAKTDELGNKFTKNVTTPVAAFATVAVASMNAVDDGFDIMATKTGATAEQNKELQKIFREIASEVPGEFVDIGSAIGEVNTRLDLTGDKLKIASKDFIKFAKVNKMDVNSAVQLVTRAMGDAGIGSDEYANILDMLTVAGQKSGISIETLTTNLAKYGAPMRALGIDTKNSIAMFSAWEKAGVTTEIAFSGMKKAISNWGAAGKDSSKEFSKTLEEIKKCPSIASATTKAIEIFGQKAGPDLADAIRGGRFEFGTYVDALEKSGLAVEETYGQIVDEVDDTQLAVQKCQLAMHDMGETIAKSVGPILSDFADNFQGLMSKFDKMDPKMQKNILKYGLMLIAIGPVLKIIGNLTTAVGSGTKAIGVFSQAVAVANNKATSSDKSINKLANCFKMLTSPLGLAAVGVGVVTASLVAVNYKLEEGTRKTKEYTNSINAEIDARNKNMESIDSQLSANMSEISNVQILKDELSDLVDANGKVKEGYESRTDFILNQLNSALGTEYSQTGDIISNYRKLQEEIDKLIAKKKAQIILEADETKYKEAIQNKTKSYESYLKTQEKIVNVEKEIGNLRENKKYGADLIDLKKYDELQKQLSDLKNTLSSNDNELQKYNNSIHTYEKNSQLLLKGDMESLKKIEQSTTIIQKKTTDSQNSEMSKRIENLQTNVNESKRMYDLDQKYNKDSKDSIYKVNYEESQKNLELIANELIAMTSKTEELTPDIIQAWINLSQNSSDKYNEIISKMPIEMQNKINKIAGVISGDLSIQDAVKFLGDRTISVLRIDNQFEETGRNWLRGINRGINDKLLRQQTLSSMHGFGVEGLNAIRQKAWDEHSPSKETEKGSINLLKGVPIGIHKEMPRTLRNMENSAKKIVEKFNGNLNFSIPNINELPNMQSNLTQSINASVKPKVISLNMPIYTQQLDSNEMNRIIETVNKRFGTFY